MTKPSPGLKGTVGLEVKMALCGWGQGRDCNTRQILGLMQETEAGLVGGPATR